MPELPSHPRPSKLPKRAASARSRLSSALDEKEFHLRTLLEVSREIARARDEKEIFRIALGTMMGAMGVASGLALVVSPEEETAQVVGGPRGGDGTGTGDVISAALGAILGDDPGALRGPLTLSSGGARQDAAVRSFCGLARRRGFRLWIPLVADGELLGGACLSGRLTGARYRRGDVQLLAAVAAQCAATIHSFRLFAANLAVQQERFRLQGLLEEHLDPHIAARIVDATESRQGSRCTVAILFADLRGFTPTSEQLEPEEVVSLLNRFLARMTQVIFAHGGTINKFLGDAIMVFFDDAGSAAEQAVRCAVAMQAAFRELQPMPAGSIPDVFAGGMGIGISMGEVVQGMIGSARRVEYTVIGTPVNLANRLSGLARGGEILADRRTFAALAPGAQAVPLSPLAVKGIRDPVPVYQIVG